MPTIAVPRYRPFDIHGLKLRALCSSSCSQLFLNASGYSASSSWLRPAFSAATAASAASTPDLIALWLPLIPEELRKPALSPVRAPPRKIGLGNDRSTAPTLV